jgi:hypothetical protein
MDEDTKQACKYAVLKAYDLADGLMQGPLSATEYDIVEAIQQLAGVLSVVIREIS